MLNNKWTSGKVHFVLPTLSPVLLSSPGIKPLHFVLDKTLGQEVVLLITEPEERLKEFVGRDITGFFMKSGLINTSFGPVYWLLFYFSEHAGEGKVIYEYVVNPKDPAQLSDFEQLANQKYWHVVIADDRGEVINFFEFINNYGLGDAVRQVKSVCAKMYVSDFMQAKAEYLNNYSIDELLPESCTVKR